MKKRGMLEPTARQDENKEKTSLPRFSPFIIKGIEFPKFTNYNKSIKTSTYK